MKWDGGYLMIGRFRGAPIRIHWSTPLGALVFGGFSFDPPRLAGAVAGFVSVVLVHELGHAALVRAYGLQVDSISIHVAGGECRWSGHSTPRQAAVIAWGGVLAQAVLLVAANL